MPIVMERAEPTKEAPQHLCLDKAYDKEPAREVLERHRYTPHIRKIGEEKKDSPTIREFPTVYCEAHISQRHLCPLSTYRRS